jgi:hypothetical protein
VLAAGLLAGHPAARAGQPDHLAQHLGGLGDGHQQGARVHQIERARGQAGTPGAGLDDRHPGQPAAGGVFPGHRHVHRVGIQAHDPPGGGHGSRQQLEDPGRAAAEVDRALPRLQPYLAEQRRRLGPQFPGPALQPGAFVFAAAQRVPCGPVGWGARAGPGRGNGHLIPP